MDEHLIDDALRSDAALAPHPFFRLDVMRRIRAQPPLAFPWRIVAIAILFGAIVGALIHLPSFAISAERVAPTLIAGALILALALRGVSDSV